MKTDTDLQYLASCEKDFYDCIRPAMKQERNSLQSGDSTDDFAANLTIFSLVLAALSIGITLDENIGFSFRCRKDLPVCVAKNIAIMTHNQITSNLTAEA